MNTKRFAFEKRGKLPSISIKVETGEEESHRWRYIDFRQNERDRKVNIDYICSFPATRNEFDPLNELIAVSINAG